MTATSPPRADQGRSWAQVPPPVTPGSPLPALVGWALTAGPVAFQMAHHQGYEAATVATMVAPGALGALAVARWGRRSIPVVAAASIVPGLAASLIPTFLALVVGVVLAVWWAVTTGASNRMPGRETGEAPADHTWTVAVPGLVACDVTLLVTKGLRGPSVPLALALLCVAGGAAVPTTRDRVVERFVAPIRPTASRLLGGNRRLLERVGRPLGAVLGAVGAIPAAVVVVVSWVAQRIVRFDPLAPPTVRGTRWVDRPGDDIRPAQAFAGLRVVDPRGAGRAAHRWLASVVAVGLVGAVPATAILAPAVEQSCEERTAPSPALDGDPGWPTVGCETSEYASRARFDGSTTYRYRDFESEWVNVSNHRRRTWRPPACDCRRIRVWWFGGSAAWGWWQRDEFSLPSQVARAAWEQGVALDIENFAQPGWVLGQERRWFAQLAVDEDELPDVAVFYDGGNDLNIQKDRNQRGAGADESQPAFGEVELDDLLRYGPFSWGLERARQASRPGEERLPPEEVARHAMARYERDLGILRRFADEIDVPVRALWQPLHPAAPPEAVAPNGMTDEDVEVWATLLPAARSRMPEGVTDLSDAFDEVDRPVMTDLFHTNELGADVAARAIVDRLGPDLGVGAQPAG